NHSAVCRLSYSSCVRPNSRRSQSTVCPHWRERHAKEVDVTALVAILTVVVALLTLLVAGLLRSHAEILRRLHALDPDGGAPGAGALEPTLAMRATRTGRRAPDLAGAGLRDDVIHIAVGGRTTRTLIAFLSSGCLTCQTFWDAFRGVDALDLPDDVRIV